MFYNEQATTLRGLTDRTYAMPNLGEDLTDWGTFFAATSFYRDYYGDGR